MLFNCPIALITSRCFWATANQDLTGWSALEIIVRARLFSKSLNGYVRNRQFSIVFNLISLNRPWNLLCKIPQTYTSAIHFLLFILTNFKYNNLNNILLFAFFIYILYKIYTKVISYSLASYFSIFLRKRPRRRYIDVKTMLRR